MTAYRSLIIKDGRTNQVADTDSVIVGSGIDVDASAGTKTLNIGTTSAEDINIGRSGQTVSVEGDLDVQGALTVITTSEFQQNATFLGNVAFGDTNSPVDDTVSFANATVNSDINFDGLGYKITNLKNPTAGSQEAATAKYVDDHISNLATTSAGGVTGTLPVGNGGTGKSSWTAGSLVFVGSGALDEDPSNLFWNNADNKLFIAAVATVDTHAFNIGVDGASKPAFAIHNGGRIHRYDGKDPVDGELLIGDGTAKNFAKASLGGGTNIAVTAGQGTLSVGLTGQVAIANGGTGQSTASAAFGALSPLTTKGDILGFSTANARVPVGTNGQVLVADSTASAGVAWATPAPAAVFAGALTVYVDPTNGTDAPGGGTLGKPYASINYAYSQVTSLGNQSNSSYNAQVGQFITEKLVFKLAPGRYSENVTLGFKRARVQLIGNGVQILGNVKMSVVRSDFPASSLEAIKASFPSPWTGVSAQMTFEITGEAGNGVEADTSADAFVVTGSAALAFEDSTLPGYGLGTNWDNNYGQFNYYANKANIIGGMFIATNYTVPETKGLPTSVIEVDSCTIGEASSTARTYFGAVPYAYLTTPSTWNLGTGVATGSQTSTTLQDTSKTWTVNQYAGATLVLTNGTGSGQTKTVLSNTANTLTLSSAWTTNPVAGSTTYSLIGTTNKCPEGVVTLKCHNSTIGATIGPRMTIGEIDGCRIYDMDRTMLGTVDNGIIGGSTSTSYVGMVVNQFRQYSGSGIPPSQYQLASALSGARLKMDSTSYTTMAFSRSSSGAMTARTLTYPTTSGSALGTHTSTTLQNTGAAWTTNQWAGGTVTLTSGTGAGQVRAITSNTATALTVSPAWSTNPANGTGYSVASVSFDLLDDARSLAYTPTTPAQWLDPDPATVGSALDKIGGLGLLAAAPANGQIPIGNGTGFTVASPTGGTNIAVTGGAGTISIGLTGTVAVANGGTGLATAPANGQLLIGNGTGYTLATLSEGTGIEITEASGTITIAATGAAASTSVEVPLTTTGLSNGDVVCVDTTADNKVKKADADDMGTARVLGVVSAADKVQVSGIALATFAAAPTLGAVAYLSNTEGVLTTTKPTSGVVSEVGIVVSATATSGKYSVLLQVKTPIQLV